MFPTVKVSISNIDIDGLYYIFLDVIPVDNKRYTCFRNSLQDTDYEIGKIRKIALNILCIIFVLCIVLVLLLRC